METFIKIFIGIVAVFILVVICFSIPQCAGTSYETHTIKSLEHTAFATYAYDSQGNWVYIDSKRASVHPGDEYTGFWHTNK